MTITGISTNVQALLTASDKFVTVLPHAPTGDADFAGYPAAFHYYLDAESNFATVSQNRRIIEYVVEIWMVSQGITSVSEYQNAYTMMDEMMQLFDESIDLSSASIPLTRACDIMRPTPSVLERVNTTEGDGFRAEIRLFCESDITFRNS